MVEVKIVLEKDEDGYWTATVPSLPGCISQGKTRADATKNIKEAISLHLEALLSEGMPLKRKKTITAKVNLSGA